MEVTFDRAADAIYIKLSSQKICRTVPVNEYCNIDLDAEGLIVGIELLFASRYADDFKLWLDLTSAAQYLNKAPITIRRWIHSGRLPHYKMGGEYAFVKEELDQFISKNKG